MSHQQFDTPGQVEVRIENKAGDVQLRTHSGTTTEVEVAGLGAHDDEGLEHVRVEHQELDGRHLVLVEVSSPVPPSRAGVRIYGRSGARVEVPGLGTLLGSSFVGSSDVVVSVRLPEGAAINVVTSSGEIKAKGRFGPARVETMSGAVSVEVVTGDLDARSASGNVEVKSVTGETKITTASGDVQCGRLEGDTVVKTASGDVAVEASLGHLSVQTASGDVTAGELTGGCRLQTASGDQHVERLVAGRARFDTVTGDLRVAIARSTAVAVDAETVSGDLVSEIELGNDEPAGSEWDGAGDRRVELWARTVSGDLLIQRARA